jgi:hypothetical protein
LILNNVAKLNREWFLFLGHRQYWLEQGPSRDGKISWPEESRVGAAGALEGRVLEVVRCFLERVLPRQREDLLVCGDEVGHPGDGGDDERLSGGVDVGLRPRQHPHARHLTNKKSDLVRCFVRSHAQRRQGGINQLTVGIVDATVATAAALAPARVASACHAETQGTVRSEHNQAMATVC